MLAAATQVYIAFAAGHKQLHPDTTTHKRSDRQIFFPSLSVLQNNTTHSLLLPSGISDLSSDDQSSVMICFVCSSNGVMSHGAVIIMQ